MKLVPYLSFPGTCEEAINFYRDCLGGTILQLGRMGEGPMAEENALRNRVMHARLRLGNDVLFMSGTFDPAQLQAGSDRSLSLDIDSPDLLELLFKKKSEAGRIKMPLRDTFWGASFGMFVDKSGIHWMMNHEMKETE